MLLEKDFYFVRHGQTDWNLAHRAQGQSDIPLNAEGRRQARDAAKAAAQLKIGTICCSPLSRAVETPPGAETYERFLQRACDAINQALEQPGPVLIVAHGGIYWAVQIHAMRNLGESLPNAQIVKHTAPTESHPWWQASLVRQ